MSRIAHLITEEEGEQVWTAGGPYGAITLHVMKGVPLAVVAHSPREIPGWESTERGCPRLEGLPCWYLLGSGELEDVLAECRLRTERDLWAVLDNCYLLYLESALVLSRKAVSWARKVIESRRH